MKKIKIELDFLIGPIIKDELDTEKKQIVTGIKNIDNDKALNDLNNTISNLYSSFYKFDTNEKTCIFDYKEFRQNKDRLSLLLNELLNRLNEINDGSFYIEDFATKAIENL